MAEEAHAACQYPPFVRNGFRLTPYWKNYVIGDPLYDIANDRTVTCIKPCVLLEFAKEEVEEPDSGDAPNTLGFSLDGYRDMLRNNFEARNG